MKEQAGIGQASLSQKVPTQQVQVPESVGILRDIVSSLETSIIDLKSRLSSVLDDHPEGCESSEVVRDHLVPLAEDIDSQRRRIARINSAVIEMLQDLQL